MRVFKIQLLIAILLLLSLASMKSRAQVNNINCNLSFFCQRIDKNPIDVFEVSNMTHVERSLIDFEKKNNQVSVSFQLSGEKFSVLLLENSFANISNGDVRKILADGNNSTLPTIGLDTKFKDLMYFLIEKGYPSPLIKIKKEEKSIRIIIELGRASVIQDVTYDPSFQKLGFSDFILGLSSLVNGPHDKTLLQLILQEAEKRLEDEGYYNSVIEYDSQSVGARGVKLDVKLNLQNRTLVSLRGNQLLSREILMKTIKQSLSSTSNLVYQESIRDTIVNLYYENGYLGVKLNIRLTSGKDLNGLTSNLYIVEIHEGEKYHIRNVNFNGNFQLDDSRLRRLFYSNANSLIEEDIYDRTYVSRFGSKIEEFYQERGFVDSKFNNFSIIVDHNEKLVDVSFNLYEGDEYVIEEVIPCQCPENVNNYLLDTIDLQKGNPLNVHIIDEEIQKAVEYLKEKGFYFARTFDSSEVVSYQRVSKKVYLKLPVISGKIVILNNVQIQGLVKTKRYVVEREVQLDQGDLITPSKITQISSNIASLNLFKSTEIDIKELIVGDEYIYADIVFKLEEKDFGRGEFAVGYRTDLGARAANNITYNNLAGKNWILSTDLQTNYRFSYGSFDQRRKIEAENGNKFLEYKASTGITFPYFYSSPINTNFLFTYRLQRYFNFDAKILSLAYKNSYSFFNHYEVGIKYQFETVNQYDATEEVDNDDFKIGSMSPYFTLDFRNRRINPSAGFSLTVSWEFANPYFLSQDSSDLLINYNRLLARAKIYVPIRKKIVWANQISYGVETNFATDPIAGERFSNGQDRTEGYIPSIKVFRLDGQDTIRGYSVSEINRLDEGEDIGEVIINDRAYLVVLKSELRYFFTDELVIGAFFDAGRVQVRSLQPDNLRTSTGTTLKYVTPVGSLNLDLGAKLKRRDYESYGRETFGRAHISIGFF